MNRIDLLELMKRSNDSVRARLRILEKIAQYLPRFSDHLSGFEINYQSLENRSEALPQNKEFEYTEIIIKAFDRNQALELIGLFPPVQTILDANNGYFPIQPNYNNNPIPSGAYEICPVRLYFYPSNRREAYLTWDYLINNSQIRSPVKIKIHITNFIDIDLPTSDDSTERFNVFYENMIWFEKSETAQKLIIHNFPAQSKILINDSNPDGERLAIWKCSLDEFKKYFLEKTDFEIAFN